MLFLTLSGTDVDFLGRELHWRTYTTEEPFPATRRVKLVGKNEFAAAELDPEHETYIVYVRSVSSVALLSSSPLNIHPSCKPQIDGLIAEKAPMKVFAEYADFANVFFSDLAPELPIYSLGPVKPFKSPAGASILFDRKSNRSLWLCVNYRGFNNLTIKNWYCCLRLRASSQSIKSDRRKKGRLPCHLP